MSTYRTGGHWQRTIVRVGTQPADHEGRRPDDKLVGMVDTPELAERICKLLTRHGDGARRGPLFRDDPNGLGCLCARTGLPYRLCPVHGKRA